MSPFRQRVNRCIGRGLRWLSIWTAIGMFVVNIIGFMDTNTGSALGCGHDWPLCNGQLVPALGNLHTLIEFSHRAIVFMVTLMLLLLAIVAWIRYRRDRLAHTLIALAVGAVVTEATLGALTVIFYTPPWSLATHMGVALIAFASLLNLAVWIWRVERPRPHIVRDDARQMRSFKRWSWYTLVYVFAAIYVGAYVASSGAGSSFRGWPLPLESLRTLPTVWIIDVLHRSLALGLVGMIIALIRLASRVRKAHPLLYAGTWLVAASAAGQALTGWWLIHAHLGNSAFLVHVSNISLLFGILSVLAAPHAKNRAPVDMDAVPGYALQPLP